MLVASEAERYTARLQRNFPPGSHAYVRITKVPAAYVRGTVTGACQLGVHVAVTHPERNNQLHYVLSPSELRTSL